VKRYARLFAVLMLGPLLAGCRSLASNTGSSTPSSLAATRTSATAASAPLRYTDATNTTVTLTKPPARIVCLVGICEDILAAIKLPPVAVTDTMSQSPAYFGAAAKGFAMIGGSFTEPSLEDIAKARPDLVIGLANQHEQLRDALKPIAPLYIMNPTSYNDSITYLRDIGRLTGRQEAANAAAQTFLDKLAAYKARSPNNKSALLLYGSDVDFNIFTAGSLPGGLLAQVTPYPWPAPSTGAPLASDKEPGAIPYSLEKILATNPDVLLIATVGAASGAPSLDKQLAANPVWATLKAVKTGQVYAVNPSAYIFGRGTISLGLALDDAMTRIYPSAFPKPLP
jgi:iron complex transport system substrate-binding protein